MIQPRIIATPKDLIPANLQDVKFDGKTLYICANNSKKTTVYHMVALTYSDIRKHEDEIKRINNSILADFRAFVRKGFLFKIE